jgi:hypothetical protein
VGYMSLAAVGYLILAIAESTKVRFGGVFVVGLALYGAVGLNVTWVTTNTAGYFRRATSVGELFDYCYSADLACSRLPPLRFPSARPHATRREFLGRCHWLHLPSSRGAALHKRLVDRLQSRHPLHRHHHAPRPRPSQDQRSARKTRRCWSGGPAGARFGQPSLQVYAVERRLRALISGRGELEFGRGGLELGRGGRGTVACLVGSGFMHVNNRASYLPSLSPRASPSFLVLFSRSPKHLSSTLKAQAEPGSCLLAFDSVRERAGQACPSRSATQMPGQPLRSRRSTKMAHMNPSRLFITLD